MNSRSFSTIVLCTAAIMSGCQSQPTASTAPSTASNNARAVATTPSDSVQNIRWEIMQVRNKPVRFFTQVPYIQLNSSFSTVQGHTGCNSIYGRYTFNQARGLLDLDVKAGHQSCDGALAQEAELIDALQRVQKFRLQQNVLLLLDINGQIVAQARRR